MHPYHLSVLARARQADLERAAAQRHVVGSTSPGLARPLHSLTRMFFVRLPLREARPARLARS
jgi:hypothetical protein